MMKESAKQRNVAPAVLGRLGGLKGGKARAESLTLERRRKIARNTVKKRRKGNVR